MEPDGSTHAIPAYYSVLLYRPRLGKLIIYFTFIPVLTRWSVYTWQVRRLTTGSRTVARCSSVTTWTWLVSASSSLVSRATVVATARCSTPTSTRSSCSSRTSRNDVDVPPRPSSPTDDLQTYVGRRRPCSCSLRARIIQRGRNAYAGP